jgi:hypothetical protein
MANIDVSELMLDPDFCDEFSYLRRIEDVSLKGRSEGHVTQLTGYGSIQPLSGQVLRMMPQLANTEGTIEIWSTTPLQTLTDTLKADIVIWKGSRYTVTAIPGNWSHFGNGFCRYVGTLKDLVTKGTDGHL